MQRCRSVYWRRHSRALSCRPRPSMIWRKLERKLNCIARRRAVVSRITDDDCDVICGRCLRWIRLHSIPVQSCIPQNSNFPTRIRMQPASLPDGCHQRRLLTLSAPHNQPALMLFQLIITLTKISFVFNIITFLCMSCFSSLFQLLHCLHCYAASYGKIQVFKIGSN